MSWERRKVASLKQSGLAAGVVLARDNKEGGKRLVGWHLKDYLTGVSFCLTSETG